LTPGLATRLVSRFAAIVLCSFEETGRYLPQVETKHVGSPVRRELFQGDRLKGLMVCNFDSSDSKPVLLVVGGSLGAQRVNEPLLKRFRTRA
jgi:UDP-N-acetylglucosamine--N-acetylmuramyl-(pentapeptide) pyrophosphoryl-undecaprenol N-acetylglucosamine transferase